MYVYQFVWNGVSSKCEKWNVLQNIKQGEAGESIHQGGNSFIYTFIHLLIHSLILYKAPTMLQPLIWVLVIEQGQNRPGLCPYRVYLLLRLDNQWTSKEINRQGDFREW